MARGNKTHGSVRARVGAFFDEETPTEANKPTRKQVDKPDSRKATYKLPLPVLDHLDQVYHRLRLEGVRGVKKEQLVAHALKKLDEQEVRKLFAAG